MSTFITPEAIGAWRLRATIFKVAILDSSGQTFIPSFDTGRVYTSQFIAVGVSVKNSKSNWSFGGYLSQEYKFTSSGYRNNGKAFNRTQDLLVNEVSILDLPLLAEGSYRLRYFPPNYFADVKIQIWEYVKVVIEKPVRLDQSDQASLLEPISELTTATLAIAETVADFAPCLEVIKTTANQTLAAVRNVKCSTVPDPDNPEPPSQSRQQFYFLQ